VILELRKNTNKENLSFVYIMIINMESFRVIKYRILFV